MNQALIFAPVLAQISLTLMIFLLLGKRRAADAKAGTVDLKRVALDNRGWSDSVIKVSNNLDNQFQTPVLFYMLCIVLVQFNAVSTLTLGLAWTFVFTRYSHAFVHVGSNYIPLRLPLFLLGVVSLLLMTGIAIAELI
ncbi:MAG: hypothetical protein COA96_06760 [SAR86 cluster bacterium]|uniref:MAPEG family protein n=1 Tax=SAR86 cluster bacterium TaxID=2030880 RepID=A0A2A5B304_9GAMM|nr:MAG: hypothetical protein COA96_06760 [SAR86 cluster bacterium]